jgi:hypothetical protein
MRTVEMKPLRLAVITTVWGLVTDLLHHFNASRIAKEHDPSGESPRAMVKLFEKGGRTRPLRVPTG